MNRDQAREILSAAGIHVGSVSTDELKRLRRIINKHLKKSGIYNGTARLTRAKKYSMHVIQMKTNEWDCRECVTFNPDGFIGIAGWADSSNVSPIIDALIEWSEHVSKPNWDKAPKWANYRAMDADGCIYWYETRPRMSTDLWVVRRPSQGYPDRYLEAGYSEDASNWKESLEERPK